MLRALPFTTFGELARQTSPTCSIGRLFFTLPTRRRQY
jgi:hypothetical protein